MNINDKLNKNMIGLQGNNEGKKEKGLKESKKKDILPVVKAVKARIIKAIKFKEFIFGIK